MTTAPFIPSSWALDQMIGSAMSRCDSSVEQARMKQEAKENARAERFMIAQSEAKRRQALYGI